jgi:integrase/recombinase XerC
MQTIKTNAGQNYLTEKEEKKFFSAIKSVRGQMATRDYVFFKICRSTGLRRSEMRALNVGDVREVTKIDVNKRIAAKGGIGEVYLSVEIQDLIRDFLRKKRYWGESTADDAPLFVSEKGNRIGLRTINDRMTKWCREAGLPNYTPHALRHTKAHRIMDDVRHLGRKEQGQKLLIAGKQLRHKSLNATMIYTQPTKEQLEIAANI